MTSSSSISISDAPPGEVITFYSYKGGTGRSMALANVGCLLAAQVRDQSRGVLMIDWDLEAPGLHRYFHLKASPNESSVTRDSALDPQPGLIDLFRRLDEATPREGYGNEDEGAEHAASLAKKFSVKEEYALPLSAVPNLYLLKAGRFDDDYSSHVNTFDWESLHRRSPWLIRSLTEQWAEEFEYVLIDSRTGLTDTSGICTMLMPEKLVVVFTPNRQSFTGVANLVSKASKYRKASDDLRPLIVFPLPSRIEASREDLRKDWRFGNSERGIGGYQPLFEELFREVYQLKPAECDLNDYFAEVQIQQTADYAYGEEIAVRIEQQHDRFSMTRSYQTFTERLLKSEGPWKSPHAAAEESSALPVETKAAKVVAAADEFYAGLPPESQQQVLRLLTRLVRVAPPEDKSGDTLARAKMADIEQNLRPMVKLLNDTGVVAIGDYNEGGTKVALVGGENHEQGMVVEAADESLVRDWPPLRDCIDKNRDFLFWRQKLRTYLDDWESGGHAGQDLLTGSSLLTARVYLEMLSENLNEMEVIYIVKSIGHQMLWLKVWWALRTVFAGLVIFIIWFMYVLSFGGNSNRNVPVALSTPSPTVSDEQISKYFSKVWEQQEKQKQAATVHIFFHDSKDAAIALSLKKHLEEQGFNVASVKQRNGKTASLILTYFEDVDLASFALKGDVVGFLQDHGIEISNDAITKQDPPRGMTPGRIEVWLPSLRQEVGGSNTNTKN